MKETCKNEARETGGIIKSSMYFIRLKGYTKYERGTICKTNRMNIAKWSAVVSEFTVARQYNESSLIVAVVSAFGYDIVNVVSAE